MFNEIKDSKNRVDISVYVSDNGSEDLTNKVIAEYAEMYNQNKIYFSSGGFSENKGFDANVLSCYRESCGDYVWFLSDDDNVSKGVLDAIINDIKKFQPAVLYYNHDQEPYSRRNPYILNTEYYHRVSLSNIRALKKIIDWPKLSALVVKKCQTGLSVTNLNGGFAHVGLAVKIGIFDGGVLHSSVFTAYPDLDYKDHINFVPYILNNLNPMIDFIFSDNLSPSVLKSLKAPYIDPLASSLNTLGAYYRGRYVLTLELREKLWKTVRSELKKTGFGFMCNPILMKEIIKFPISLIVNIIHKFCSGKKLEKER